MPRVTVAELLGRGAIANGFRTGTQTPTERLVQANYLRFPLERSWALLRNSEILDPIMVFRSDEIAASDDDPF